MEPRGPLMFKRPPPQGEGKNNREWMDTKQRDGWM
jgi:hypothetical protein